MVHVELDTILTEEDALQRIKEIFDRVETEKVTYVITHNGKPSLAIVDIATLEHDGSGEPFHTPTSSSDTPTSTTPAFPSQPSSVEPELVAPLQPEPVMQKPSVIHSEDISGIGSMSSLNTPDSTQQIPVASTTEDDTEDLPPMPDMPSFSGLTQSQPVQPTTPEPESTDVVEPSVSAVPLASTLPEPETDLDNSSPLA